MRPASDDCMNVMMMFVGSALEAGVRTAEVSICGLRSAAVKMLR